MPGRRSAQLDANRARSALADAAPQLPPTPRRYARRHLPLRALAHSPMPHLCPRASPQDALFPLDSTVPCFASERSWATRGTVVQPLVETLHAWARALQCPCAPLAHAAAAALTATRAADTDFARGLDVLRRRTRHALSSPDLACAADGVALLPTWPDAPAAWPLPWDGALAGNDSLAWGLGGPVPAWSASALPLLDGAGPAAADTLFPGGNGSLWEAALTPAAAARLAGLDTACFAAVGCGAAGAARDAFVLCLGLRSGASWVCGCRCRAPRRSPAATLVSPEPTPVPTPPRSPARLAPCRRLTACPCPSRSTTATPMACAPRRRGRWPRPRCWRSASS